MVFEAEGSVASALAATAVPPLVMARGHKIDEVGGWMDGREVKEMGERVAGCGLESRGDGTGGIA